MDDLWVYQMTSYPFFPSSQQQASANKSFPATPADIFFLGIINRFITPLPPYRAQASSITCMDIPSPSFAMVHFFRQGAVQHLARRWRNGVAFRNTPAALEKFPSPARLHASRISRCSGQEAVHCGGSSLVHTASLS